MDVAWNKQIEATVAVEVPPSGSGRPVAQRYACVLGDICKRPVVIVMVEPVLAEVRHVDIGPAVVVVVSDGNSEAPAIVGHTSLRCHIGERAVVIVMEQCGARRHGAT